MNVALVLGSGGVAGVSWTIGLLAGLQRRGLLDHADVSSVVGTSAGAFVAAAFCAGTDLDALVEGERAPQPEQSGDHDGYPAYFAAIDRGVAAEVFQVWSTSAVADEQLCRRIGALALRASPRDPEEWVTRTRNHLPIVPAWDGKRLQIVGVDCETGRRVVWTGSSGVEIIRAIAASSAVPGLVPPVLIDGRAYMDGGVWSSTNADVIRAAPAEQVLITCPQARLGLLRGPSLRALEREKAMLEAEERGVAVLTPGSAYDLLGPNHMSQLLRAPAVEIGLQDAEALDGALLRRP